MPLPLPLLLLVLYALPGLTLATGRTQEAADILRKVKSDIAAQPLG